MKIEAVILYSTNDSRFFKTCIENLLNSDVKCHVVTYSHMWNGTPENDTILRNSQQQFIDNLNYNQYTLQWNNEYNPWYWEGIGRYLATQQVSDDADYILYIDIDEIVDVELFKEFIYKKEYTKYDTVKLSNYWYFREPTYQADQLENSIVLCKSSIAKSLPPMTGGREIYFQSSDNKGYIGEDNPFIHHYSWVRTKEEMLNKVKNWGHAGDRNDWIDKVEEEFSREFNGKCFINNYNFNKVENKFNV